MHRLIARSVAALGGLALLTGATAAAVELTQSDSAAAESRTELPSAEVLRYWSDARTTLTPLLLYVRVLPESIAALEARNGAAKPGEIRQAKDMAESFATARDLVGRLPVPAAVEGDVGELLQVACQLYRESALTLVELKGRESGAPALATLRRANALHLIGDRLIDQTRRVLNIDAAAADQAPVELQYPPAVPSLAEIGGAGAGSEPAALASSLERTSLEKSGAPQGEDVIGARLAVLLDVIAAQAETDGQSISVSALRMLSTDLWNTARTLAEKPALPARDPSPFPRSAVWTGGAFAGRPPALQPGDHPDAGLPGGLPPLNLAQILRG